MRIFSITNENGATHVSITPEGIKFLAAFAACVSGSPNPVAYENSLQLLIDAPESTDDEISQWSDQYLAFVAAERDREFGPATSAEAPLQTSNLQ